MIESKIILYWDLHLSARHNYSRLCISLKGCWMIYIFCIVGGQSAAAVVSGNTWHLCTVLSSLATNDNALTWLYRKEDPSYGNGCVSLGMSFLDHEQIPYKKYVVQNDICCPSKFTDFVQNFVQISNFSSNFCSAVEGCLICKQTNIYRFLSLK